MKELLKKYINNQIEDEYTLDKLRDDEEFMLQVFRKTMKAIEFDKVTERLKDDENFIQRTKYIFSANSAEYFSLCIALRQHRKEKASKENVNHLEENGQDNATKEPIIDNDNKENKVNKVIADEVKAIKSRPSKIKKNTNTRTKNNTNAKSNSNTATKTKTNKASKTNVNTKTPTDNNINTSINTTVDESTESDEELQTFISMLHSLPLKIIERENMINNFKNSSKEKRIVALMMLYDFVQGNDKPVKHIKKKTNSYYHNY